MKRWMVFGLAVAAACGAGADELLDAVLQWDQPVTWTREKRIEPAAAPVRTAPARTAPARTAPSKTTPSDDLLDEVLNSETPSVPAKRPVPSKTSTKTTPGKAAASGKGGDKTANPTRQPITREEWMRQHGQTGERQGERAETTSSPRELTRIAQETDGEQEDGSRDRSAAAMERAVRLSLRGGGGGGNAVAGSGEVTVPLGKSMFDLAVRGFGMGREYEVEKSYTETYYTTRYHYTFSLGWHSHRYRHTQRIYYTAEEKVQTGGVEALVLWRPLRGYWFSPYVGVGGRYEDSDAWEDDSGGSVAFRAGTTLNLGRWWLGGEFAMGDASNEVTGTLGWRWGDHIALHAGVNRFEAKGEDGERRDGVTGGGGLTWVF